MHLKTLFVFLFTMALAGMSAVSSSARADAHKPLVIFTFAGYEAFFDVVSEIGDLANDPQVRPILENALQSSDFFYPFVSSDKSMKFLLDEIRRDAPVGLMITREVNPAKEAGKERANGEEDDDDDEFPGPYGFVVFVPTKNHEVSVYNFLQSVGADLDIQVREDGVNVLTGPPCKVYLKPIKTGVAISLHDSLITQIPEDAFSLMHGLDQKYLAGARCFPENLDAETRDMLRETILDHYRKEIERREESIKRRKEQGDPDDKWIIEYYEEEIANDRKSMKSIQLYFEVAEKFLPQLQSLEAGALFDKDTSQARLYAQVKVVKGSDFSKVIACMKNLRSQYSGFASQDALFGGSVTYEPPPQMRMMLYDFLLGIAKFGLNDFFYMSVPEEVLSGETDAETYLANAPEEEDEDEEEINPFYVTGKRLSEKFGMQWTELLGKYIEELAYGDTADLGVLVDFPQGKQMVIVSGRSKHAAAFLQLCKDQLTEFVEYKQIMPEWVKTDVQQADGWRFHQLDFLFRDYGVWLEEVVGKLDPDAPWNDDEAMDEALRVVGERILVTAGVKGDRFVFAYGVDAPEAFRKAVAAPQDEPALAQMQLSLEKIFQLMKKSQQDMIPYYEKLAQAEPVEDDDDDDDSINNYYLRRVQQLKREIYTFDLLHKVLRQTPGEASFTLTKQIVDDTTVVAVLTAEKGLLRLLGSLPSIFTLTSMAESDEEKSADRSMPPL